MDELIVRCTPFEAEQLINLVIEKQEDGALESVTITRVYAEERT